MRPKKTILLVDANERQAGITKFALQLRKYRVLVAHDAASALALHDLGVDLVLGFADGMLGEWPALGVRMRRRLAWVPILLVGSLLDADSLGWCDGVLCCQAQLVMAELLERIRGMIAHKRGPKMAAMVPVLAGD